MEKDMAVSNKIVSRDGKWYVYSHDGDKKLGGPYDTKEEAEKRLREIEYFKHKKNTLVVMKSKTKAVKSRMDRMEDRDWQVVPMVMLVEGVHNGSCGALYYPQEELEKTPQSWNHKPIVVYHPDGPTACTPEVLTNRKIGVIMNTRWEEGKLKAEGWLDPARMTKVDSRVAEAVENGAMLELSTGLFTDTEGPGGEWNNECYDAVAKNYRPDHLAVLPDQIGACSMADGAGFIRNENEGVPENVFILTENGVDVTEQYIRIRQKSPGLFDDKTFRTIWISKDKGIKAVAGKLKTPPEGQSGSMVIQSYLFVKDDWKEEDAKKWVSEHKTKQNVQEIWNEMSHDEIRMKLQKEIELKQPKTDDGLPKAWSYVVEVFDDHCIYEAKDKLYLQAYTVKGDEISLTGMPEEVVRIVQYKTANVSTDKVIGEKPMDKKELIGKLIGNELSGWTEEDKDVLESMNEKQLEVLVGKIPEKKNQEPEKKVEEPKVENKQVPVMNTEPKVESIKMEAPKAPATADEYIAAAPKEIQNVLTEGLKAFNAEKGRLIETIIAHPQNSFTKEFLALKGLDELRGLAKLVATTATANTEAVQMFYTGQAPVVSTATTTNKDVEILDLPAMSFDTK